MPSHIFPEVYTWELRLSLMQGFHQYEVPLESRIGVPPVNFSKIFHPGHSCLFPKKSFKNSTLSAIPAPLPAY